MKLFARHGYAAVSMRKIAAGVGVQVGALYAYTPDKQALLADLLIGHMEELLRKWSDDSGDDPLVRLERFVRFHIAYSLDHSDRVFLSYMELRNLTPENFQRVSRLRDRYEAGLESILRDGQAAGAMRIADTRLTTMALIAMLTGVTNWYRAGGRLDRERIAEIYLDLARNSVGSNGAGTV